MGYIFTKTNAVVAIVFAISFGLSINEIVQWVVGLNQQSQQAFIDWQQRSKSRYTSQAECQKATQAICNFETCDYVPAGKTLEEVCGVNFEKGWKPSSVPIPQLFQYLDAIRLTIETLQSTGILMLKPKDRSISYASTGLTATSSEKQIEEYEMTLLTNSFILYDFPRLANRLQQQPDTDDGTTRYQFVLTATLPPEIASGAAAQQSLSATCSVSSCPRALLDLKNGIIRLWKDPVAE